MPTRTPCKFCGKVGYLRTEHVIAHGKAEIHYYCGLCDRTWQVDDAPQQPPRNGKAKRKSGPP